MLNFVLCDDNKAALERFEKMLNLVLENNDLDGNISLATTNVNEVLDHVKNNIVDVVILDIDLNTNISGLELAQKIRKINKKVYIIFETAHLEYLLLAYKCKTFDYLPKPISLNNLESTISRLFNDIRQDADKTFIELTNGIILNTNSVLYIEKNNTKLVFKTTTGEYSTYSSFNKFQNKLPPTFIRCHKSYIANVSNINHIDNSIESQTDGPGSILEIKDLCFAYPEEEKRALNHISFQIKEGEFLVLCGKSGCGKSTLLKHMKTPLTPHGKRKGEILFDGKNLHEMTGREQSQRIGYVLQNPDNQIVTDKVWHELAFGLESLGYKSAEIRIRVAEMASYFGIQDWFYKNVAELSGGQKQLLNLASIMAMHPDILILDEPTSQLDPIAASDFLGTVKKINRDLGTTILLTEHRLEEVFPAADRVVVMEGGEVLCMGTPEEIGEELKKQNHEMFLAMPVPMQIYAKVNSGKHMECPITVRDGRNWLNAICKEKQIRPQEAEFFGKDAKEKLAKEEIILEAKDIWFRYDKDQPDVVKGLNLSLKRGEFFALLGGNGTGKSTTLSIISRLRKPYRGKVLLEGKDIRRYSEKELFRGFLGVLPQNPQSLFVKKTVELELFEMVGGTKEKKNEEYHLAMEKCKAVEGIVKVTHLEGLLHRHPYDLSGGEQQRLALAKILLLRPKLLLMDEPTKGLDSYFKKEFAEILDLLKKQGVTIFMISHDIEFCASYADRCGLFFDGNIAASGTPKSFFAGNNFYTTAANRMARKYFPMAVTAADVAEALLDDSRCV